MALAAELARIQQEIAELDARAAALCDGLREAELAWRPKPESWSIAENLWHLRTTSRVFAPAADRAIEEARRKEWFSPGPFRLTRMGRFFVWWLEPPPVLRLPAPKMVRPQVEGPPGEALAAFLESQRWMRERVEAADGLDLHRARVVSPLASYIRMDLLAFFCVFTGHGRRHLWQAGNVRRQLKP